MRDELEDLRSGLLLRGTTDPLKTTKRGRHQVLLDAREDGVVGGRAPWAECSPRYGPRSNVLRARRLLTVLAPPGVTPTSSGARRRIVTSAGQSPVPSQLTASEWSTTPRPMRLGRGGYPNSDARSSSHRHRRRRSPRSESDPGSGRRTSHEARLGDVGAVVSLVAGPAAAGSRAAVTPRCSRSRSAVCLPTRMPRAFRWTAWTAPSNTRSTSPVSDYLVPQD